MVRLVRKAALASVLAPHGDIVSDTLTSPHILRILGGGCPHARGVEITNIRFHDEVPRVWRSAV